MRLGEPKGEGRTTGSEWRRNAAPLLALVALTAASPARAVGIGGFEVQSSLGQPLRMVVQVSARPDEVIDASCFKLSPYSVASDGLPQLTSAQVVLERSGDQARLVVTSTRAVNDPIVRVSLDVGCGTTLRRELTLLLDPAPVIASAPEASGSAGTGRQTEAAAPSRGADDSTRTAAAPQPGAEAPGTSTEAGAAPAAPQPRAGTRRAAPPHAAAAPPRRVGRVPQPADQTAQPPAPRREPLRAAPRPPLRGSDAALRSPSTAAAARAASGAPRDRLTIAAGPSPDSLINAPLTPRLTLSTSMSDRRGQPPLSESALGILRQKQARLRAAPSEEDIPSLEAELVVLQKKAAELRAQLDKAMAEMQTIIANTPKAAQAPAAAAQGAATPVQSLPETQLSQRSWFDVRTLLAAMMAVLIALLIAVMVIWVRRERADRRRQQRWNKSPYVPATTQAPGAPPERRTEPTMSPINQAIAQIDSRLEGGSAPAPDSHGFVHYSAGHAASQLGVSDLAQATEKASVFMTLGRSEQAIDVLRDHIDHEPKPSPMAWLMLLDLYRQTGQRDAFIEVADRFHRRFNAATPLWERPDDAEDAGLVLFPRVIGYIRKDWPGLASLECIENLLYDNRGGSRIGFSLAAFRDLLLLHNILDEYMSALAGPARTDPVTGELIQVPTPDPPSHLARAWIEAPAPPGRRAQPALELAVNLLADSPDCSALEKGLPVVAEAIIMRWGKPGVADYLTNLISLSKDDRNSDVSSEMMSELLMLQEVASAQEEESSELRDLSFR